MKINGVYDIFKRENHCLDCACAYGETDRFSFGVIGDDADGTVRVLEDCFGKPEDIIRKTDSLFIAVAFDRQSNVLHIFSDLFSSEFNLYYTVRDNRFYYSSSLKWLLKISEIERTFDRNGVDEFLINGFIPGENTLIKGVKKLTSGVEIVVDKDGVRYEKISAPATKISNAEAKNNLLKALQDRIKACAGNNGNIDMPVSGGYDSNLILNTLANLTDRKIRTFSVGEDRETSEIVRVRQNMKFYENAELNEFIVSDDLFDCYTDMVWRLDGCVFESGIVLQYALAKAAREKNVRDLICGEYADQLMNKNFEKDRKKKLLKKYRPFQQFTYLENPFVTGSMIILKKSAVMLNSFGITGHYPFASESLTPFSKALAAENGTNKKYYISQCKKVFPKEIVNNIAKEGGTTTNQAFLSEEKYEELREKLNLLFEQADFCKKESTATVSVSGQLIRAFNFAKKTMRNIKKQGIKKGLSKSFSSVQSRMLGGDLLKLYLLIFNELIISKEYDDCFENESAPLQTTQLIDICLSKKK